MSAYLKHLEAFLGDLNAAPDRTLHADHCLATYDHDMLIGAEHEGFIATVGGEVFADVIRYRGGKFQRPTKVVLLAAGLEYVAEVIA